LQAAIKSKYGMTAELREGVGGIFEVSIDNEVVYTNETTYRFPPMTRSSRRSTRKRREVVALS
jgi:hypothetical protein